MSLTRSRTHDCPIWGWPISYFGALATELLGLWWWKAESVVHIASPSRLPKTSGGSTSNLHLNDVCVTGSWPNAQAFDRPRPSSSTSHRGRQILPINSCHTHHIVHRVFVSCVTVRSRHMAWITVVVLSRRLSRFDSQHGLGFGRQQAAARASSGNRDQHRDDPGLHIPP